jgi:dTDP-glucose 4,6-dehydratase
VRILITGGAGFIASHLSDRLLADGHTIVAVDNFLTGSRRNIAHLEGNPAYSFIEQDVTQPYSIDGALDGIFHLASPASPIDYLKLPIETMLVGSVGTYHTLEIAKEKKARFFLSSTSEIYGDPLEHPQKETYWGNVDPNGPRSVYDEAKRFAEAMVMAYHRQFGLETRIVRIFNTYGPRMRLNDGRVVPNFIDEAIKGQPLTVYGDGKQTRAFCYVEDEVDGLIRLFMSDEPNPVNIGNPHEMTILEFAQIVNEITGNEAGIIYQDKRIQGDPQQRKPDITRARTILGWEPRIDVREGLSRTIAYFKENQ